MLPCVTVFGDCSGCFRLDRLRVGLTLTGKRRLSTAHTPSGHGRPRFAARLLRGVQPSSIAAGAHESSGHRASVLAALEYRSSGDESGLVALDTLHEAATAGWHVVDQ